MNIKDYRVATTRTLPDLGSLKMNLAHMGLGFASELEELNGALYGGDQVGIAEEIADWCWYGSNTANYLGLELVLQYDVETYSIRHLMVISSALCDHIKKYMAYNREIDKAKVQDLLQQGFNICFNFDVTPGKRIDLPLALERNIAKLKKRFPDKFNDHDANNRDLRGERSILEGGNQ